MDEVSRGERAIESLLLDGSRLLWVSEEFYRRIEKVLRRIPPDDLCRLSEIDFWFLAPDPGCSGMVTQFEHPVKVRDQVVFLSPALLAKSEAHVEWVIAHELAHVFLGQDDGPTSDAAKNPLTSFGLTNQAGQAHQSMNGMSPQVATASGTFWAGPFH